MIPAGIDAIASFTRNTTKSKNGMLIPVIITLGWITESWAVFFLQYNRLLL